MYPILIEYGAFIVPAWHTFFALGAVAAYFLLIRLAKTHFPTLSDIDLGWLFAVSYIGGYFGARVLSLIIDQPDLVLSEKILGLFQLGPMTFYGGFVGATVCGMAFAKWKKMAIPDLADMALICGMLGLAIGRVGCFLNGDDYGIALQLDSGKAPPWWAVTFSNHAEPLPRVPVQLFETFAASLIVVIAIGYFKKIRSLFFPGAVALFVGVAYAMCRFFLEYLRGDPRGSIVEGVLSPSQLISILVIIAANVLFFIGHNRKSVGE